VLYSGYSLLPLGRELLAEIADVRDTPFRLLARGLLSDETHRTLTGSQGPGLSVALAHSAAESVARYARVVVHEMVNTLAPVRVALETLGEGLKQGRPVAELLTQCTRIDRGIEQAFQFLEDSKTTASLTEVREPFDIGAALRSMEEGIEVAQATIERQIEAGLPKLLGHRDRFVVAMRDLLRNAVYAGHGSAAALQVRVTARLDGSHVLISVEDNGPGVPVAERHLIFAPGFSRRTGGSGQGLSLLKEVIETDHGGTVDCDTSSLGGARFTVRIPLIPGERP
jgi:signal transduction histidine kinase